MEKKENLQGNHHNAAGPRIQTMDQPWPLLPVHVAQGATPQRCVAGVGRTHPRRTTQPTGQLSCILQILREKIGDGARPGWVGSNGHGKLKQFQLSNTCVNGLCSGPASKSHAHVHTRTHVHTCTRARTYTCIHAFAHNGCAPAISRASPTAGEACAAPSGSCLGGGSENLGKQCQSDDLL